MRQSAISAARYPIRDEELCVHCGACVGQCRSGALTVEGRERRVGFHPERCVACELCVPACSYGALELLGERAGGRREL
ncbi:MAG: 4Fe-4S binding protein [Polyangia bacterium]